MPDSIGLPRLIFIPSIDAMLMTLLLGGRRMHLQLRMHCRQRKNSDLTLRSMTRSQPASAGNWRSRH
jgi:hypothetical protein